MEDRSCYDELSAVDGVGKKIVEFAPTMGSKFVEWLLVVAEKEGWEKKSVYEHLLKPNREGKIALAHITYSNVFNCRSDWS